MVCLEDAYFSAPRKCRSNYRDRVLLKLVVFVCAKSQYLPKIFNRNKISVSQLDSLKAVTSYKFLSPEGIGGQADF